MGVFLEYSDWTQNWTIPVPCWYLDFHLVATAAQHMLVCQYNMYTHHH